MPERHVVWLTPRLQPYRGAGEAQSQLLPMDTIGYKLFSAAKCIAVCYTAVEKEQILHPIHCAHPHIGPLQIVWCNKISMGLGPPEGH